MEIIAYFLVGVIGFVLGALSYMAFLSFMFSRGYIPKGLRDVIMFKPEFLARIK